MNITVEKRFLSLILSFVLVLSLVPVSTVHVHALSEEAIAALDGSGITIKSDNSSGSSSVQNGTYTFTAEVVTSTCSGNSEGTNTVTITNPSTTTDVSFSFSWSLTGNGTLKINDVSQSATSGNWTDGLGADSTITFVLTSGKADNDTVTLTLRGFALQSSDTRKVTVSPGVNGTVKVKGTAISAATEVETTFQEGVQVSATANTGYEFLAWQDATGKVIATTANATIQPSEDMTVSAVFAKSGEQGYWTTSGGIYSDLNEACEVAKNGDGVVVLANNATLPADKYTIPAGVTLLIPCDAAASCYVGDAAQTVHYGSYATPSAYRTLTLADGVTLEVYGVLNVGAKFSNANGGNAHAGAVCGKYGCINMLGSSKIDLKSGATMYAWGYVIGSETAEVVANSGATVHELLQITDFKGGTGTTKLIVDWFDKDKRFFPFSQYYVQNIEVKEVLHYGSFLNTTTAIYMDNENIVVTIPFIGDSNAMFSMEANTVVVKQYFPNEDRLKITLESGTMNLSGISMTLKGNAVNSADFNLPVNSNISINIQAGTINVPQDILMMPGSEITVAAGATVNIAEGSEVYVFDAGDWGNYVFSGSYVTHKPVTYVGSRKGAPVSRSLTDVKIDINGTINATGKLYTSAGGGQVISSQGTGVVNLIGGAPSTTTVAMCTKIGSMSSGTQFNNVPFNPAVLTNGNGSTEPTSGAAAGTVYQYCNTHDRWYTGSCGCCTTGHSDSLTDKDHNCDWCDEPGVTEHVYTSVVTDPTCTEKGYTTHTCNCGHTYKDTEVAAKGHADSGDTDHNCDVCGTKIEECYDTTPKDHICDECGTTLGECSDSTDADHNCDYCGVKIEECYDTTPKDHICDECGTELSKHSDGDDTDHNCDYCDAKIEECYDTTPKDHICDECGTELSKCSDGDDTDHNCDHCGAKIEECYDATPKDHICDECGGNVGTCADSAEDTDHVCDYGCGKVLEDCADVDKDHKCDYGCDKVHGICEDADKDHDCDYGCDKVYGTHVDENPKDHVCDYGCSVKDFGGHVDADKDHVCDYGCSEPIGDHADANKDHVCDYGCSVAIGTHADSATDKDHVCDYGCGEVLEACSNKNAEEDHNCDVCGEVLDSCTDATTDTDHNCDVCDKKDITTHEYTAKVTAPTCEAEGYTTYTCNCGHTYTADETEKIPHTEEILPAKDPTCTETGLTEGKKCSVCNEVLVAQQTIPAKGHTEVIDAAKAPTCTETGLTEGKHCSVCGAVIVEQTEIDALGHTFGSTTVAKAATCIATGNEAYKQCSRCSLYFAGDAEINATDGKADTSAFVTEINPNNHVRTSEHGETPATCLMAGYTAGTYCEDCKTWISGHEGIPAIAHKNKVYHAKVDATCVETGTIEYWSCPDCDKNFSDEACTTEAVDLVIPKDPTKHVNTIVHVEKPATCLEAGYTAGTYCNDCETWISGHEVISAKGHNMQETAAAVAPTCTTTGKTAVLTCANGCGKTEGGEEIPVIPHSGGTATCLEPKKCTVCGASYGDKNPSNHVSNVFKYTNKGATHAKYYACCEALAQASEAHNHVEGKCVCGDTLSYTVYWKVNGAVAETDEGLSYGTTPAFDGETPAKAHDANYHYSFAGWAASADGEVMATLPAVTKTVTYYAVFTAEAHTDAPADQNHACDVCGRANVSDHTYSEATCTVPATCTDCGATTGEALGHIDASPKDHKCDRECGEVSMGTHEAASGRHTCDYCSQAVTHCKDSLDLTPEVPADCTTDGNNAYYTCSVCGKYYSDADATQEIAKDSWITPATGHAFEELGTVCTNGCGYTRAAKIGDTSYETLDEAMEAAQPGDTIVALTKIVIEEDVTWDLTGKKLDVQYLDAENYALVVKGKLTIKGGEFHFENIYGLGVAEMGTLVIDGGKFTTLEDEYLIGTWGTTTINGGTFEAVYCNVNGFKGTLTVNGGNFTVTGNDAEYPSSDVFAAEDVATIYGGTYSTDISEYLAPEYKAPQNAEGKYVVEKCDHENVTEVIAPAPTCTEGGLATYTCVDCQHVYTKALPANGHKDANKDNVCDTCTKPLCTEDNHKYETIPGKAATCTATGLTEYLKCTACGHIPVQQQIIPIIDHTYGAWIPEVPATCDNAGVKGHYHCSVCNGDFDSNKNALNTLVITATGHKYVGAITENPTCTEPGIKTFTCQNDASHTYTEPVSAKGHTYGTWITEVPATCTVNGVKAHYHCDACGADFDADKNPLTDLVIPATDHSYDEGVITTPATCTEPGVKTFTCQNDTTHTYTEEVEAKGHAYGEWIAEVPAKCTEDGTKGHYHCDVCGKNFDADKNLLDSLVIDAPGHTEVTDKAVAPTCTEKGKTEGTRCDVCKAVLVPQSEVPALGHKDENTDHVCDNGCDVYQGTHADSAEDDDHVCDYGCKAVLEDCSDVPTDKDHDCDVCGKENVTVHDYKAVVTDPTCEADGYTTYTCNCTHTYTGDAVSALGHKDENKDHVCDNGCGVYQGKHEDTDKDHQCDYGCTEAIGTCADSDHDHDCDYGCDKAYGTHEDTDKNHKCDYGCTEAIGTCADGNKDHYCDYGCGKYYGTHADSNGAEDPDHNCDYCGTVMEACSDTTPKDHICDECGAELSHCSDSDDPDHNCDYCGQKIENCYDNDTDHICDECGSTMSQCADGDDENHDCDYCGKENIEGHTPGAAATCETDQICTECKAVLQAALGHKDDDKNHACDNGCDVKQGDHKDDNKDHKCDYGCKESIGTCEDADHDHDCDYGCTKYYGIHEDTDKDHKCDYGCTVTIGTCEDTDKDHACDYGCDKAYGTHEDTDFDHACDYGCKESMGTCEDSDHDHDCDYGCSKYYGEHKDSDHDHACDYGCKESIGTCEDSDHDHACDYGCDTVYGEHTDDNKDHACDYGCDTAIGDHADSATDKDHVCDYGCGAVLEVCTDNNRDHACDNGCDKFFGEHVDKNKDHACDYGCAESIGTCEDTDHDHDCDYGCDAVHGTHEDIDRDHDCDYGCSVAIGTCEDKNFDHVCDYECDKYFGTHEDTDHDHACDYGCAEFMGTCEDADHDHDCDYGCDLYYGTHEDTNHDHACDYGCAVAIGDHADSADDTDHVCDHGCGAVLEECVDNDKDHACDNGCDLYFGTHEDTDHDHNCDYGCTEKIGTHEDADSNHLCDYGCAEAIGDHEPGNGKHTCDYCGEVVTYCKDNLFHASASAATCTANGQKEYYRCYVCAKYYSDAAATQEVEKNSWVIPATGHADTNKDHICDNGCGKSNIGTHADSNKDHLCDYGCSEAIGTHADQTGDGDHICDYCRSDEVLTQCIGGTPVRENENPATVAEAGSYDSVVYCSECDAELSRTNIAIPQLLSRLDTEEMTDDTIPETIKTNPNYNTVEKLADAMTDAVVENVITDSIRDNDLVTVDDVQSEIVDVTLKYSTDGKTWLKADEEHFPKDGKIEIILPVPDGTKHSRYTYYVAHMFTSNAFGNTAGEMEYPEVEEIVVDGQECIRFFVTGLSPITVSYLETEPCADGHTHDSYGFDETNHWSICSICGETFDTNGHTFENDACGCGAKRVKVVAMGEIQYTVSGQTVTVTHNTACKVGYLVNGKYTALPAIKVSENCYRFIAPADVEEVLLVAVADLDQDGDVDADDMNILSNGLKPKAHESYKKLDVWQQFAADVNGNGKLNAADLLLVARSQTGHEMYKALTW
ncbi:MAG: hypothetical protein IJ281_02010 [Clostridia bacterium]|nr:hypothetical protein [Clostridia bacterium]